MRVEIVHNNCQEIITTKPKIIILEFLEIHITQTDNEIDQMVYALYGLTEEEIGIVENS